MTVSVLVVDDEQENLDFVERTLAVRFAIHTFLSTEAALEAVEAQPFDIVIADHRMPEMSGVEFLSHVCTLAPDAARILLTGFADLDTAMDAVNRGRVNGFLHKPIDADKLLGEVDRCFKFTRIFAENRHLAEALARKNQELSQAKHLLELDLDSRMCELMETKQQLEESAIRDELTGLYNHRHFHECAERYIAASLRHGYPTSLLFVDVDWFKVYNDAHGRLAGDRLLATVATLIGRTNSVGDCQVRKEDVVARYGGEEFVLILPSTPKNSAIVVAERLRVIVHDHPFAGRESQPLGRVTVSIGVAECPQDSMTREQLVREADKSMSVAKAAGRNCVVCAGENIRSVPSGPGASGSSAANQKQQAVKRISRLETALAREKLVRKEIEQILEDRTRELYLAAKRLEDQQSKLVQTKLDALGEVTAGVAHEINNALNFVCGNIRHMDRYANAFGEVLDVYRKAIEEPELAARLQQAEEAARLPYIQKDLPRLLSSMRTGVDRAVAIVRDLGIFSRPQELNAMDLTDLRAVIETALTLGASQLKRKKVTRKLEPVPWVHCHAGRMSQVYLNVLFNAAQATPDGGEIEVGIRREDDKVVTYVRDEGQGIDPKHMDRIFEPFFTTKSTGEGTGLGLFLCMQILTSHNGSIWCESTPGKGSTFYVALPMPRRNEVKKTLEKKPQEPER